MRSTTAQVLVEQALGNRWMVFVPDHQPGLPEWWRFRIQRDGASRHLDIPDAALTTPSDLAACLHRQMVQAA